MHFYALYNKQNAELIRSTACTVQNQSYMRSYTTILHIHGNKMFEFEERVLIGWLTNTVREPANQNACLKVKHFCFYVKVACLSYVEYN